MLVSLVQRAAAAVPPHQATAVLLLVGSLAVALFSLWAGRRVFVRTLPAALYVALAAACFLPLPAKMPAEARIVFAALAAVFLLIHLVTHWTRPLPEPSPPLLDGSTPAPPNRTSRRYLVLALAVAGLLLFYDLGGYAGPLLGWESGVAYWYLQAVLEGQTVLGYVGRTFLWDNGVLSAGNTSLFFGAPTWVLYHLVGFSPWILRICAVLATLLSIGVIYAFARRFFGSFVAAAAAALYGTSTVVLLYGRYGSSPAGTLLAVLLALWSTWTLLARERPSWWLGLVCAATLYFATLQYAPARIVVLILLGFIAVVMLWQWRRLRGARAVALGLLALSAVGMWELQGAFGTQHLFLFARGEQFMHFLEHRDYLRQMLGRDVEPANLQLSDEIELVYRVAAITVPQYVGLLEPAIDRGDAGFPLAIDPPPVHLYFAPLVVFLAWGFIHSLLRITSIRHLCLLAIVGGSTVPLLLTNRVDAHRMVLFVIPLTLWMALGVWEAAGVLAEARVPRWLGHTLALAIGVTLIVHDVDRLYFPQTPTIAPALALTKEVMAVPGPVVIGPLWDHRQVSWAELQIMDRSWREPGWTGSILPDGILQGVRDVDQPPEIQVRELARLANNTTVILAPAERFRAVAALMQQRGIRVAERGEGEYRLLRLDGGAAKSGVPDADMKPLPTIVIPPTMTPIALRQGPRLPLLSDQPRAVTYGFEPPKFNLAFGGGPLALAGVTYDKGIGMHAWTRLVYDVPAGAIAFQAIVGVADGSCEVASVSFEVHGENDELLFDSGLLDHDSAPRALEVDLKGAKMITLLMTEGGNGRDCDHANLVQPAFLLGNDH